MNKGTPEGTEEEIKFVKELNKNKSSKYWDIIKSPFSKRDLFAIHVIHKKYGKINKKKIMPKADIFLAYSQEENLFGYLEEKEFYLNEDDLKKLKLAPVNHTGISVKRPDSNRYQIMKMNPSTFKKIFGNYELGAGASIFCKREEEFEKNDSVIKGWKIDNGKFNAYFKVNGEIGIKELQEIKKLSTRKIYEMIAQSKTISDFIFRGVGNFEEPYTATWFYEKGILKKAEKIPFIVTTGSGRSHGDFTIVIKPK